MYISTSIELKLAINTVNSQKVMNSHNFIGDSQYYKVSPKEAIFSTRITRKITYFTGLTDFSCIHLISVNPLC